MWVSKHAAALHNKAQLIASAKQSVHLWFLGAVWTYAVVSWFDFSWLLEWYAQCFSTHGWGAFLANSISTNATKSEVSLMHTDAEHSLDMPLMPYSDYC